MKKVFIVFIFLIAGYSAKSMDNVSFFSPGIKVGYIFGDNGGLVFGLELSYVYWAYPVVGVGPTLNLDYFNKSLKIHLNAEVASVIGLSAGPTLILIDSNWKWGYNATFFAGLQYYLYYNFTNIQKYKFDEIGLFLKMPLLLTGRISAG